MEWHENSNELYDIREEIYRNDQLRNTKSNNTIEATGTSSLTVRANDETRESSEDSRKIKNRKVSPEQNARNTTVFERDRSEQVSPSTNVFDDAIPVLSDANVNRQPEQTALKLQEVIAADSSDSLGLRRHKKHKHKHNHKHKSRSKLKSESDVKLNVSSVSENGPCSVPFSSPGCTSTTHSKRKYCYEEETDEGNESKYLTAPRRKSPTIEEMLNEISELDVKIQQHEKDLLSLGQMEMR